jgi:hypothetical protein
VNIYTFESQQRIGASYAADVKVLAAEGNQTTPAWERSLEAALQQNLSGAPMTNAKKGA